MLCTQKLWTESKCSCGLVQGTALSLQEKLNTKTETLINCGVSDTGCLKRNTRNGVMEVKAEWPGSLTGVSLYKSLYFA